MTDWVQQSQWANQPDRVRSTFRGVSREDALQQAAADNATARARGYEPEGQEWQDDGGIHVLAVTYRKVPRQPTPGLRPMYAPDRFDDLKPNLAWQPTSNRSRLAAALLAIFLGGLGVHKFYTGKTLLGLVYLLFCWTLIPAVVGFFEGIWYLTMSDDAFWSRYP